MASRTTLISVTHYDSHGGLDWSWHGSQWLEWYECRRGLGHTPEMIEQELKKYFDRALVSALSSGEDQFKRCKHQEIEGVYDGSNKRT